MTKKSKKWYNNGVIEEMFEIGTQPEGWFLGFTEATKLKRLARYKQTCLEKYGVENVFQLEDVKAKCNTPEAIAKANSSRLTIFNEKYGVDNPSQLDTVKEQKKKTCLQNYGVECGFQTDLCKEITNSPDIVKTKLQHAQETLVQKYGVTNPYLIEEIYNKAHSAEALAKRVITNSLKSDSEKLGQIIKYLKHRNNHYLYNEIFFDSMWELAYYIYCLDHNITIEREPIQLNYQYSDSTYYYIPDFRINNNELIEIKSDYLFNKMQEIGTRDYQKLMCMQDNNVTILLYNDIKIYLDYIDLNYGKKYLKQFKYKKQNNTEVNINEKQSNDNN